MSDVDHARRCYDARLANLQTYFVAAGHSASDATTMAASALRGQTRPIEEPLDLPVQDDQSALLQGGGNKF